MLSLLVVSSFIIPIATTEVPTLVEGRGTVIIGGTRCQMIALDDGRFVTLQAGALPNLPLEPLSRIRIRGRPLETYECGRALPVQVDELQHLPRIPLR